MATTTYVPPGHISLLQLALNDRTKQRDMFDHVLAVLLQAKDTDPLTLAMRDLGYSDLCDIINMSDDEIFDLVYEKSGATGAKKVAASVPVPPAHRQRLRIFISMYYACFTALGSHVDVGSITYTDFTDYRITHFNPTHPLRPNDRVAPFGAANGTAHGAPAGGAPAGGPPPPPNPPAYQGPPPTSLAVLFERGIKRDKEHYPEFKDEKFWDNFRRGVEVTADTHGTLDVLDATFVPDATDNDAIALFRAKNRFMYAVFEAKIKTDMGISIVRSHEVDRNAQDVWRELVNHQMTSTTGRLARQKLLTHLTTFKLDSSTWKGTHVGFLVNFQNKLREYERLTPVADHYSDEMKRILLQQAVSSVKALDAIKNQCELEVVQGRAQPNFAAYTSLIRSASALLDARHLGRHGQDSKTAQQVNFHGFDDEHEDDDDYGNYDVNAHSVHEDSDTLHNIDTDTYELEAYRAHQSNRFKKAPY
jgi:hypothetical protein